MRHESRPVPLMRVAVALLGVLIAGRPSGAQDDGFDDLEASAAGSGAVVQPQPMIADSNFDVNVFGNLGNRAAARQRVEALLRLQVDEVDRVARLSGAQRKKLELAGRGDLKRFFDRVEVKRKEFQLVRSDPQKYSAFYQELRPLQAEFQGGLFGIDSIYARTVKTAIDPDQVARYEAVLDDRRRFKQRARVGLVVAKLDTLVGLTAEQRGRLTTLILEATRPPRISSSYDFFVTMYQLARLPPERLKPGLSASQWSFLSQQLDLAQRYRTILENQNLLPDEKAADARAVAADPSPTKTGAAADDARKDK